MGDSANPKPSNFSAGNIRKVLDGLPDDVEPGIVWRNGPPGDDAQPGVELCDIRRNARGGFEIVVDLFYLDEALSSEDDEDEETE